MRVIFPLSPPTKPDYQAFVVFTREITHDFLGSDAKAG